MNKKTSLLIFIIFLPTIMISQSVSREFRNGMDAYHSGDYAKAILHFEDLLTNEGTDQNIVSTAEFYYAEALMGLDEIDGAAARFEMFVNTFQMSNFRDLALYRLGTIYYNKGKHNQSRERLVTLIKEYPSSEYVGSSYYWVGESFSTENKFKDAEEFLKEAISSTNNNFVAQTIYALANLYERVEEYTNAVTYYDELLAYHKESELAPFAQMRIGVCYFKLKEYDSVVIELSDPLIAKLSIQLQTEAKTVLANSFFRLKEYDNAAKVYQEILDSFSGEAAVREIQYGLAWVNFQMKEYGEAYRLFSQLARNDNDTLSTNSLFWSAESKRYLGENDLALNIYERFLENYPESRLVPKVRFNSGIIYYAKEETSRAERYLISAVDSDDEVTKGKAFTLLGEISLNKKDFDSSINYFSNAIKIKRLNDDIKNRAILGLGIAQYYTNDFDNALINLSDLNSRFPRFEKDKVNFFLAEVLFATGEFSKALTNFSRIDLSNPELGGKALYGKAYSYFNLKDYANSTFYFDEFLKKYKTDKNRLDAKFRLAESYYGTKNFDKASDIYRDIFFKTKAQIKDDFSYYQFAQALFNSGRAEEAIKEFETLQRKFPRSKYSDDSQYLIGWINFQQGNFEKAINSYETIFDKYPNSAIKPIAYYSIGDSYYNLGQYDSALVYYTEIMDKYPNTQYVFDAINGIQYCYVAKDQPDNAISIIDIYVANNPSGRNTDQILYKKGEIYYSLGSYENAKIGYNELIETYSNSTLIPDAYFWIGKSSQMMEEKDEAEASFNYVVENYMKSDVGIAAVIELGKIYEEEGDFTSAIDLYTKAINALPDSRRIPEILFAKGMTQVQNNGLQQAYETLNEIIMYYDKTVFGAKAKIEIGILELERKDYTNAESFFKDLGESRKDDLGAQAQYYYGVTLFEQEKFTDAVSALVRVRSVFSGYDEWYSKSLLKLGDCYVKMDDKKNAREMYRAVVKRHKNDELGKEANQKLRKL